MEALKRAAASPSAQTRRVAAITIGVILEAAVYVPSGWPDDRPGIAVAAGILIAALAGAVGGVWSGLAVAGAGWGFHYFFVSQDDLPPLIGLPAWLAVGALAGWLSTTRRRTARARAHLARELGTVRDSSSEAILAVDAEGTIVSWSRGAEELYGYEADDAIGSSLSILGGEDVVAPALVAVHAGEHLHIPTAPHRRKSGDEIAVSLTVAPLGQDDEEDAPRALLIAADVGESRRIDARRREIEAKYRALTEQLPTVTYVHPLGARGECLYISPQVSSMLGYSPDEWLAQPGLYFQLVHPEDRERVTGEIDEASASTAPLRTEYRMLSRDGRVVWVQDEAVTVRDDDGRPLYVQGFLLDVSERRQAGEERDRL